MAKKRPGSKSPFNWKLIQAYYDQGRTAKDCMEKFGFSKSSWLAARKRGDVKSRPRVKKPPMDKEAYRTKMRNYMYVRYHEKRAEMFEKLGGRCARCGTDENLQIDHVDRTKKTMSTERMTFVGEERRNNELTNCQLLCGPCHSRKTVEDLGQKWAKGEHGTVSTLRYCKCNLCKAAKSRYNREYRKRKKQAKA